MTNLTMHAVVCDEGDKWFDQKQVEGVSSLLNQRVKGVRVHTEPQKKLYDHTHMRGYNRLTLMLNSKGDLSAKDDGLQRRRERMSEE